MAKEKKYELIPASTLNKFKKEFKAIESEEDKLSRIEQKINLLSKNIEESIKVNIELQEKVAEMMIYLSQLVEILEKHSPITKSAGNKDEFQTLAEQNNELTSTLRNLEEQLKKEELRESIRKALSKTGAIR